jgi:hypothetical protein
VTAVAVGLEVEADDLRVLSDGLPALRAGTTLVQAHLYQPHELLVSRVAALGGIETKIRSQSDAIVTVKRLQQIQVAIRDQQDLQCATGYFRWDFNVSNGWSRI